LAAALTSAQTIICEPIEHFRLEVPATALPNLLVALAKSGASTEETLIEGGIAQLRGMVTSAQVQAMRRVLPGLSGGAGVLESAFDHYSPIAVPPRARARTGANPFDRINYLRAIH
jgi:ribosomal protection tetracycline resistance protein